MKWLFLLVLSFLFSLAFVSAGVCDDFCLDEGYEYGACRDTLENTGFCEGRDEDAYSFSSCVDFQRCCCGEDAENSSVEKEDAPAEALDKELTTKFSLGDFAKKIFGSLLLIAVVLGLIILVKKKAFSEEKKEETTEE